MGSLKAQKEKEAPSKSQSTKPPLPHAPASSPSTQALGKKKKLSPQIGPAVSQAESNLKHSKAAPKIFPPSWRRRKSLL